MVPTAQRLPVLTTIRSARVATAGRAEATLGENPFRSTELAAMVARP
jgi:hypothetical protein